MREHKYRAWINKLSTWAYEVVLSQCGDAWGYCGILDGQKYFNVELEQYTGLKDKSGREIYEGDIVRHWVDLGPGGEAQYISVISLGPFGVCLQEWMFKEEGYLPEIIGNIHQTPELAP